LTTNHSNYYNSTHPRLPHSPLKSHAVPSHTTPHHTLPRNPRHDKQTTPTDLIDAHLNPTPYHPTPHLNPKLPHYTTPHHPKCKSKWYCSCPSSVPSQSMVLLVNPCYQAIHLFSHDNTTSLHTIPYHTFTPLLTTPKPVSKYHTLHSHHSIPHPSLCPSGTTVVQACAKVQKLLYRLMHMMCWWCPGLNPIPITTLHSQPKLKSKGLIFLVAHHTT
jgi:hypothetical protein